MSRRPIKSGNDGNEDLKRFLRYLKINSIKVVIPVDDGVIIDATLGVPTRGRVNSKIYEKTWLEGKTMDIKRSFCLKRQNNYEKN